MRLNPAALVIAAVALLAGCSGTPTPQPSLDLGTNPPASPSASPSASPTIAPTPTLEPTPTIEPTAPPSAAQLIGQKLVVAMSGTTPTADLLGRIKRGEIGGVILFGKNIATAAQVTALTTKLRAAAAAGGQPPLLISTDQEGGSVKRISWAPPTISPPKMGAQGDASVAFDQGAATGRAMLDLGINLDLAPVADVPASTSSFMYQQGRTWSFSSTVTASLSAAFASGLESAGELPSMKHFPGIGFATLNTDSYPVTIKASRAALDPGLLPYRSAIANGIPLIMLSNATYTAWDSKNAAGWSRAICQTLLRDELGFTGATITDSLTGTAVSRGLSQTTLAIRAATAGLDFLLLTGSEASTKAAYEALLARADDGRIPRDVLEASYERILELKSGL